MHKVVRKMLCFLRLRQRLPRARPLQKLTLGPRADRRLPRCRARRWCQTPPIQRPKSRPSRQRVPTDGMYTAAPNAMPIGSRFRFICRTFSTSGSTGRASAGLACSAGTRISGRSAPRSPFRENADRERQTDPAKCRAAARPLARHCDQQLSDFTLPQEIVAELKSHAIEAPDILRSEMGTYGARSAAPQDQRRDGCRCSLLST
ncbi:hypothetical protein ACVWZV_009475 [Bradyrhizobium sp. GM5.1]